MKDTKILNYLIAIVMVSTILGCSGATTRTTISPPASSNVSYVPADNTIMLTGIRKVAIFPFADYSYQQCHLNKDCWGGNIKILEAITDQLVSHGLTVTVQEDVNTALVDENIIRPINKERYLMYGTVETDVDKSEKISTPEYEAKHENWHSPDMTDEILKIVNQQKKTKKSVGDSPVLQGATVGLTREKIISIGDKLGVDLIIRGRIIDYGYKDIGTVNPLYRGVICTVIDSVKDILYGATNAYGYENDLENIENLGVGATLGYIIDENSAQAESTVPGTALGAASGWMASQHPKKAKRIAVVQVRLYAQNALNGEVLWSNRAEIEYTPKSNFAYYETHPKTMFDNAVKDGIKQLMDDFFKQAETVAQPVQNPVVYPTEAKPGV